MTGIWVLVALTVLTMSIGFARDRLPWDVVRVGYVLGVATPLLALAYAIWQLWNQWVGWRELALLGVLYVLIGLGVTVGYHRLLSHRSFETGPAVKGVLLVLGAMAMPSRPIDFAAYHLEHHAHSDRDGDPHSPREGLLHAHVGWMLGRRAANRERYCRHLLDDPVVAFVQRTTMWWFGFGLVLPVLIDGWRGFLWGGLVRMALQNHATFSVNSICHAFGRRPFATRDQSRNNWLIAFWSLGEGWHNNHHAFPSAASHGMGWRQFDLSALVIRGLAATGLAWDVKGVPPGAAARRRVQESAGEVA